jgi:hypothetical protein
MMEGLALGRVSGGDALEEPPMTIRCSRCGGPVVEIVLDGESSNLTMRSCSVCDAREWASDGDPVELDTVLGELSDLGTQRRNKRSR